MRGLTPAEDRSEIAFFDLETTIPFRAGQGYAILEFGSILVCPKKLVELRSYSVLVRPANLDLITPRSVNCNGIKREDVESAPSFADIADTVYDILHGRIWAGHNILKFDCPRIREAFAEIGRDPPEPKGTIDSLALLTQRFGRRAGDMKMATLAAYFGLGNQTHRSLDDVRMNFEVLKYCATVLFLESSLPDELIENSGTTTTTTPETSSRRRRNIKTSPLQSPTNQQTGESSTTIPILSFVSSAEAQTDLFDMSTLKNEIAPEVLQSNVPMKEENNQQSETVASEGTGDQEEFLELDKICISSIRATHVPLYDGSQTMKLQIVLGDKPLQLHCPRLKVQYGINGKFLDKAWRRKLYFVVDLYPSLCNVLQICDSAAQTISVDSGSASDWNPAVFPMKGFLTCPTARIHIRTELNGDADRYAAEIYQKEFSGGTATQKLISSNPKAEEIESLLDRGTVLDAYLSLEPYDYQQRAGIRLVARKLVIYPFDMSTLKNEIAPEVLQSNVSMKEEKNQQSETVASEGTSDQEGFLELDKISISSIRATHVPLYDGSQTMKLQIVLGDKPLRLNCPRLKVRFGINGKFLDKAGRRRLNFVVDLYPSLCNVLQECDSAAQTISVDSGSTSDWNPAVIPMKGFLNCPTARIHIPRELNGDVDRYAAEIYQKEFSGGTATQQLIFSNPKAEEIESLLNRETVLDAYLSVDLYDYQQRAGIYLVARKLVID